MRKIKRKVTNVSFIRIKYWRNIIEHFIEVVKFNNKYFEHGDVVAVTTNDDKVIVGSVMISGYSGSFTSKSSLALDTSEKYRNKREFIYYNKIKNIQKINE